MIEHLLLQRVDDLESRGPIAGQTHDFSGAFEPLHSKIVFSDRGPCAADIELHFPAAFITPSVFDFFDSIPLSISQGTIAKVAPTVGGQNTGLLERRCEQSTGHMGQMMVDSDAIVPTIEQVDAMPAVTVVDRSSPSAFIKIGMLLIGFTF